MKCPLCFAEIIEPTKTYPLGRCPTITCPNHKDIMNTKKTRTGDSNE